MTLKSILQIASVLNQVREWQISMMRNFKLYLARSGYKKVPHLLHALLNQERRRTRIHFQAVLVKMKFLIQSNA